MTNQLAKVYRYLTTDSGNVPSSVDQNNVPLQVTLNNRLDGAASGAAIIRNFDGQIMLPASGSLIAATANGVWEYDHTYLNLDPAYDYTIYFRFHNVTLNDNDIEAVLIAGNTDEDSRANLRRRIGTLMFGRDRFQYGPVLSADGNSVSANFGRRMDSGWLKGRNLFVVSGVGSGQETFITESDRGSGRMTVSPSWSTVPNTTSTVEVWGDRLSVEDVNSNINLAILDIAQIWHARITETVLSDRFSSDRYTVPIPVGMTHIYRVRYRPSSWPSWYNFTRYGDQYNYDCVNGEIIFNQPIPSNVDTIYIDGYRKPVLLRNDSDVSDVPSAFVVYQAAAYCEAAVAGGQQVDPEQHSGRAGNWLRLAAVTRAELLTRWEPNTHPVEV